MSGGLIAITAAPVRWIAERLVALRPGGVIETWMYLAGFETDRLRAATRTGRELREPAGTEPAEDLAPRADAPSRTQRTARV